MKIDLKAILILTATAGAVFFLLTKKVAAKTPARSERQAQADLTSQREAAYRAAMGDFAP